MRALLPEKGEALSFYQKAMCRRPRKRSTSVEDYCRFSPRLLSPPAGRSFPIERLHRLTAVRRNKPWCADGEQTLPHIAFVFYGRKKACA